MKHELQELTFKILYPLKEGFETIQKSMRRTIKDYKKEEISLVITKVGTKYFLLGVSSSSINMLKEIPFEDLSNLQQTENKEAVGMPQFKNVFTDLLSKKKH